MKILISAFACDPYGVSESGVGWTATSQIARDHDVFVLTDFNNKKFWDKGQREGLIPENIQVRFLRKSTTFVENRFIARIQSWLWYAAFNRLVLSAAQEWHTAEQFDLCHQVTIAAWRMPSPLWKLPIPFIWGPIGGAGYIPSNFRSVMSLKARFFEFARDVSSILTVRSRSFRNCMKESAVIIAANEETESFLLPFRAGRPIFRLPVLSLTPDKIEKLQRSTRTQTNTSELRLFAGGNMIGSKGVSLALKALAKVKAQGVSFNYTIAGGGPEIGRLKQLASQLGLQNDVNFHPGYAGEDYIDALHASDLFLLPSFRETMGMTLVEAILAGCYPIVADTSAQGEIVRMTGGTAVPLTNIKELISDLANVVIDCSTRRNQLFGEMQKARAILCQYLDAERYDREIVAAYALCKEKVTP